MPEPVYLWTDPHLLADADASQVPGADKASQKHSPRKRRISEISDAASYLAPISEIDRACKYPYNAPEGGFILAAGRLLHLEQAQLDQMDEDPHRGVLAGRTPVLSVGSNRAPIQLLRKFGPDSFLLVTPARLHDCDITNAAILG